MVKPPTFHIAAYGALFAGIAGFGTWTIANDTLGYPYQLWFIDMMDAQSVKAYERPMAPLPEGVVARDVYRAHLDRNLADGTINPAVEALQSPLAADATALKQGEWGYQTYCAPCHSTDGAGNGPVTNNTSGKRFQIPGSKLAGADGALRTRSDGYLYTTIRNGGALMPGYGWALNDTEIWSIVAYLRTMPDATYSPPQPAGEATGG